MKNVTKFYRQREAVGFPGVTVEYLFASVPDITFVHLRDVFTPASLLQLVHRGPRLVGILAPSVTIVYR